MSAPPITPDAVLTAELEPALPPNLPPKLRTLLLVHARVESRRHQARVASPDGTVHRFPDGPVMRVRTEQLVTVPRCLGCAGLAWPGEQHQLDCPARPYLERTPRP